MVSKINTTAQITLVCASLADEAFQLNLNTLRLVLLWVTAAFIVAPLATYLHVWLRHMAGYETD